MIRHPTLECQPELNNRADYATGDKKAIKALNDVRSSGAPGLAFRDWRDLMATYRDLSV